ncbi:hypothetical protein PS627_03447 [Pseudomonas fluorescens]|uniref:hypothetical protein n=1 Tax=Pseudomonas fluorescens TaxID=294 RepID=UPI00125C5878|nr:hypothetical protein [Pseudomonas fluorescens]CAG8869369.1 hypothetical protein PS627_03447 [Pseudomonas fluorescens]VVP72185.1 hypothetical protein PS910_01026 [Pseudomonas fluorescens]
MESCIDLLGPVRHLIGTRYVPSVKTYILEMTGMSIVVGPTDPATHDKRGDRVFVLVDEGFITDLRIG